MGSPSGDSLAPKSRGYADTVRCRWRKSSDDEWSCALHGRILSLRQDHTHLHYRALFPHTLGAPPTPPSSAPPSTAESSIDDDDTEALMHHYFNLAPNLTQLYEQWSSADSNFKRRAPRFTGVRILKQDAWEALVGFICSSNNNIARISQMVSFTTIVATLNALLTPVSPTGGETLLTLRSSDRSYWISTLS